MLKIQDSILCGIFRILFISIFISYQENTFWNYLNQSEDIFPKILFNQSNLTNDFSETNS